jgi:hypothetical protein
LGLEEDGLQELQFFDAVFHIAPQQIEVIINELGVSAEVGDPEALVGNQASVFHLGDGAAGPAPGLGLIIKSRKQALFPPGILVGSLSFSQERRDLLHHAVVGDGADYIADLLLLQIAIQSRHGKTGIGLEEDQGPGISLLVLLNQPFEHGQGAEGSAGIAGRSTAARGKPLSPSKTRSG